MSAQKRSSGIAPRGRVSERLAAGELCEVGEDCGALGAEDEDAGDANTGAEDAEVVDGVVAMHPDTDTNAVASMATRRNPLPDPRRCSDGASPAPLSSWTTVSNICTASLGNDGQGIGT